MMLMMTKTPLGRLCASDHAMHAVEEMHYHDEAFEAIPCHYPDGDACLGHPAQ